MKRLFLLILLIASPCWAQTYDTVVAYGTVEGHWKLQDDTGTDVIVNEAGTNATIDDGTFSSVLSVDTGPTSWLPKAIDLPGGGADSRIELGSSITLTGGSTIAFWANRDNTSANHIAIATNDTDRIRFNSGGNDMNVRTNSNGGAVATGVTTNGEWHHYAVVMTDGGYDLYVDGAYETSGTGTDSFPMSWTLSRMGVAASDTTPFNGRLAEVIIFSEALDAGEISALYSGPSTGNPLLLQLQNGQ